MEQFFALSRKTDKWVSSLIHDKWAFTVSLEEEKSDAPKYSAVHYLFHVIAFIAWLIWGEKERRGKICCVECGHVINPLTVWAISSRLAGQSVETLEREKRSWWEPEQPNIFPLTTFTLLLSKYSFRSQEEKILGK